jgi:hypothetical protein
LTREEKLTAQGWERQSTNDEPRLSELVQMYRDIGYEVHLEPFQPEEEAGCSECMKMAADSYKTIYVKKTSGADPSEEEL